MSTKTIPGLLRDIRNGHIASHISVTIEQTVSPKANARPEYRVSGSVSGRAPGLSGNSFLLDLGEAIAGEVSLVLAGIPDTEQTRFDILLQGPEWNDEDWFDKL